MNQPNRDDISHTQDADNTTQKRISGMDNSTTALEKYQFYVNSVPDIIFQLDPDGTVVFINDIVRQYGYSPEDIIGKPIEAFVHPDDLTDARWHLMERRTDSRITKNYEIRLFSREQETKTFDIRSSGVTGNAYFLLSAEGLYEKAVNDGVHFIGTLGVARDITDRKRVESALKKSEAILKSLFDATPAGIGLLFDRVFIRINAAMCSITGYTEDEMLGRTTRILYVTEEEYIEVGKDLYGQVESKGLAETEARLIRKDGRIIDVQLKLRPIDPNDLSAGICSIVLDITKQKNVERALRESEHRFRRLADNARDVVYRKTVPDARYEYISPVSVEIFGYSPEEFYAHPGLFFDILHPDWRDSINEAWQRVAEGIVEDTYECQIIHKSGDVRWVSLRNVLVKDDDGKCIALEGIISDITGKKLAEEDLRKSEDLLKEVGSIAKIGGWETDVKTLVTTWTREVYNIFDLEPGSPIPGREDYIEMYLPQYRPIVMENLRNLIEYGKPMDMEVELRSYKGVVKWCHAIGRAVYENGVYVKRIGTLQDISERKRVEQTLRVSEEKYGKVFHTSPDAIAISRVDTGEFIEVNNGFYVLTGYNREEIIGENAIIRGHDIWVNKKERDEVVSLLAKQSEIRGFESVFWRKDGSKVIGISSFSLIEIGGEQYLLSIVKDITEKKQLEEQFLQTQKLESVGRLAGGIAHDFNNLLTVISGTSDLALMYIENDSPFKEEFLEISRTASRAADLTRQLLAFSRRQIVNPRVIDLNEVIMNMDKMLRRLIGEDIELVVLPAKQLWPVNVDAGQIEQVLTNLVVNARDAVSSGGRITIETANVALDGEYVRSHFDFAAGEYVMLAVSDNGAGMDEATKAQIFEPFFTTKKKGEGTGLGLSTCYGIIRQSNGYIWVYSEPGHGSVFKVYLPRELSESEKLSHEELEAIPGGDETILVVEDEASVRKLLVRLLREHGYTTLHASHGEEAIQRAHEYQGTIHLLLTDVVMPIMGGRETAEKILTTFPDMRVLFMSGYTDDSIIHHRVLDSGLAFIQKPFTLEGILRKVRDTLDAPPRKV